MSKPETSGIKIVSDNRKARFNYEIVEVFEAGLVLTGAEIKGIREHGVSLQESYVRVEANAAFLLGAHIRAYTFASDALYDPVRPRKLLLHKREIVKLKGRVEEKGLTVVPLKLYLKGGRAKVEIALAKGKAGPDKRESIKARESKREIDRAVRGKR